MSQFRIRAYNGHTKKSKMEWADQLIEASTAAEAVTAFLLNLKFADIGPNGIRVNFIYNMTEKYALDYTSYDELHEVFKFFPAKNNPSMLIHAGEPK